ncbi:putative ABC transport system permease protein [Rhodanobacter sp. ANJX3]|uniref:ABC transporter permease n=1 Tax=Rhodanobacter sp. ANJX3 TaxID=2723083 RepID=UPI001843BAC4|nr:putative ABC transport system permease protein [Rhodanobacter sp. ANJX3]
MQIKPILVALRRHKAGTVLIAMQIALTLAIVCNGLFIIQQRLQRVHRPSGIEETNLFAIENQWVDKSSTQRTDAQIQADLIALRHLPSVQDASQVNSYPLSGEGWTSSFSLTAEQSQGNADIARYFADDHTLAALGVKLIAGRNFHPDEITDMTNNGAIAPAEVILSRALAEQVFRNQSALGKKVYVTMHGEPGVVIGVTDTLQGPFAQSPDSRAYNAVLLPARLIQDRSIYLVRARPRELADAMREAPKALFAQSRLRIIDPERGVRSFAQVRAKSYEADRGMAALMGIICAVLLVITAAGIVGLTSFWVAQRRKQIGVRRALGARKGDILSYFLTENFLISAAGVMVGSVLAMGMSWWLVRHFEMRLLPIDFVLAGVLTLLLLGQAATLAPALRASRVPPVEATRSI